MAAFVAARIEEDAAAARAVLTACRDTRLPWPPEQESGHGGPVLTTFLRHFSESRELREVEAKRARLALMIEAQANLDSLLTDTANRRDQAEAIGRARAATVAVTHDAAVWSDHPDYDQKKWSPERLKPGARPS